MNRYGAMAKTHWQEWLPGRYRALIDPNQFFEQLGQEAEREIETRYQATLTSEPADLSEAKRAGWRAMARLNAEEAIVAEMILIAPDTPTAATSDPQATSAVAASLSELGREEILRSLFEAEARAGLTEPFVTRISPDENEGGPPAS